MCQQFLNRFIKFLRNVPLCSPLHDKKEINLGHCQIKFVKIYTLPYHHKKDDAPLFTKKDLGQPAAIGAGNGYWRRWKAVLHHPATWPTCISHQGVGQERLELETATGDGGRRFYTTQRHGRPASLARGSARRKMIVKLPRATDSQQFNLAAHDGRPASHPPTP